MAQSWHPRSQESSPSCSHRTIPFQNQRHFASGQPIRRSASTDQNNHRNHNTQESWRRRRRRHSTGDDAKPSESSSTHTPPPIHPLMVGRFVPAQKIALDKTLDVPTIKSVPLPVSLPCNHVNILRLPSNLVSLNSGLAPGNTPLTEPSSSMSSLYSEAGNTSPLLSASKEHGLGLNVQGETINKELTHDVIVDSSNNAALPAQCPLEARLQVGIRIQVYWDGEEKFFAGEITRYRPSHRKCWYVEYRDGDRHWIDPSREKIRIIDELSDGGDDGGRMPKAAAVTDATEDVVWTINQSGPLTRGHDKLENSPLSKTTARSHSNCILDQSRGGVASRRERAIDEVELPQLSDADKNVTLYWAGRDKTVTNDDFWAPDFDIRQFCDMDANDWMMVDSSTPKKSSPTRSSRGSAEKRRWSLQSPNSPEGETANDVGLMVHIPISEKVKLGRRRSCCGDNGIFKPSMAIPKKKRVEIQEEVGCACDIDAADQLARQRKEWARPLTQAEIRAILGEDPFSEGRDENWVRRSVRQPSRSVLNSPLVKALMGKLRTNDTDMVVLKMKKYVNDPNTPQLVFDAVLDALEDNTNCEALYIQNFNEGMRDEQVLRLLEVLQRPSCKIWCLNIGETYKVKRKTWKMFAKGLRDTKITHMYMSEHTITPSLKDLIRSTIRGNRSKHKMHSDPENLETIVQCTHCWWNPINTKTLRPFIKKKGYEHMLHDTEKAGLFGSTTGATLV